MWKSQHINARITCACACAIYGRAGFLSCSKIYNNVWTLKHRISEKKMTRQTVLQITHWMNFVNFLHERTIATMQCKNQNVHGENRTIAAKEKMYSVHAYRTSLRYFMFIFSRYTSILDFEQVLCVSCVSSTLLPSIPSALFCDCSYIVTCIL